MSENRLTRVTCWWDSCSHVNSVIGYETSYTCAGCGSTFSFWDCPNCGAPCIVPARGVQRGRSGCMICPRVGSGRGGRTTAARWVALDEALDVPDEEGCQLLFALTFVGGHGVGLEPGEWVTLAIDDDELRIVSGEPAVVTFPYSQLRGIELGGPGRVVEEGGFVGGGFGVSGFLIGALAAGLLNSLSHREHIESVIGIQSREAEVFLSSGKQTPDQMRLELSRAFVRAAEGAGADHQLGAEEIGAAIRTLAKLRADGLVTDAEFEQKRRELLDRL